LSSIEKQQNTNMSYRIEPEWDRKNVIRDKMERTNQATDNARERMDCWNLSSRSGQKDSMSQNEKE
jgi:hypothetical protein